MIRTYSKWLAFATSAWLLGSCAPAESVADDEGATEPVVYRSDGKSRLSPPSRQTPEAIVRSFLAARGAPSSATDGLRQRSAHRNSRTGMTHLRFEQLAGGLRIHGAYVKATLDPAGQLVHVIDGTARAAGSVNAAQIDAEAALAAALAELHPTARAPAELRHDGTTTSFARGNFFHSEPTVERVVIPTAGGLAEGFLVETWTVQGNRLHHTLVSGTGAIENVQLRTAEDSYNVFVKDPNTTPQSIVSGAAGWLNPAVAQTSQQITGNNVHAYMDADKNNAPDSSGIAIADGNFVTTFDPVVAPNLDANRSVAVQNLFYLNNVIHDTLYAAGFTEEAANFQDDNLGRGGIAGDAVNAEAQDGGGLNNANFATPEDGRHPRMQMYLWSPKGTDQQLVVRAPDSAAGIYSAQSGAFSAKLPLDGISGEVVVVNDGSTGDGTGTLTDGCEPITGLAGKIAFIERGLCSFAIKVKNAQDAGAIAVIVGNNQGGDAIVQMGGADPTIAVAATLVSQNTGATIKAATGVQVTLRATVPTPVALDGDLDSDIVFHEYGHGLTWRMIGDMSGVMSGAIGEGMSDVLALIMNEDDIIGEYAYGDPRGIRSAPYAQFPRTYKDFHGRETHYDGELYGAIGWRLLQLFKAEGIPKSVLLGYLVDGMNYTKPAPHFEDMRDGILQAAAGTGHECLIWRAFAAFGVGVDGRCVLRGPRIWVNDSTELPPQCR